MDHQLLDRSVASFTVYLYGSQHLKLVDLLYWVHSFGELIGLPLFFRQNGMVGLIGRHDRVSLAISCAPIVPGGLFFALRRYGQI